jgi:hypothetical protein
MKIHESVFGSESEKELFKTLKTQWSQNFDVFPSLPFASIIDIDDPLLSDKEKNFLYESSADYTLCTKRGKTLVSVEFDGLYHGFSRNWEFIHIVSNLRDRNRKLKLNLKLRLCVKVGYPLFVVSYHEKAPIDKDATITIVDGLIGKVLAQLYFQLTITNVIKQHQESIIGLLSDEQQEYFQQLITDTGVEAQIACDPIALKAAQLQREASRKGIWNGLTVKHLCDPELPNDDPYSNYFDVKAFKHRIEALKHVQPLGCKITIRTPIGSLPKRLGLETLENIMAYHLQV